MSWLVCRRLPVRQLVLIAAMVPAWPDIPAHFLLCREDRVMPAAWLRRVVPERLGIAPDEVDGGHSPFLSRPAELAERLESYL